MGGLVGLFYLLISFLRSIKCSLGCIVYSLILARTTCRPQVPPAAQRHPARAQRNARPAQRRVRRRWSVRAMRAHQLPWAPNTSSHTYLSLLSNRFFFLFGFTSASVRISRFEHLRLHILHASMCPPLLSHLLYFLAYLLKFSIKMPNILI